MSNGVRVLTTQLDEPAIGWADVAAASSTPAGEAGGETGERMAAPAPARPDPNGTAARA